MYCLAEAIPLLYWGQLCPCFPGVSLGTWYSHFPLPPAKRDSSQVPGTAMGGKVTFIELKTQECIMLI